MDETTQPVPAEEEEPQRVRIHAPVDVRSLSLAVLAVLGTLAALHWAAQVFVPVLMGLMFSYALAPAVDRLERWRIPRALAAAVLLLGIVGGLGWAGSAMSEDASTLLESLPEATQKVREAVRARRNGSETAIDKVQKAATQLEQAAQEGSASGAAPAQRGVTRVRIERPQFDIKDHLWWGTVGLIALVGQAVVVLFITFFLLASGSDFRRKMVKLAGPKLAQKRVTVEVLNEITEQIQRYLLVQLFTSVLVGLATGLAFAALGLQHAVVWGVAAGVLNLIPYIGSIVLMGASALVAFVQFGNADMPLLVAAVSLVVHTIAGNLLTPWLTSRTSRMNPVAVFVGVLAFGWLWGVWGLLLGVPILAVVKAVCDRVDTFKAVGEMLGN